MKGKNEYVNVSGEVRKPQAYTPFKKKQNKTNHGKQKEEKQNTTDIQMIQKLQKTICYIFEGLCFAVS